MNKLPLVRNVDIVIQNVGQEVLIYDLKTHKTYNLNETAAIVYKACDGKTSVDKLKEKHKFTDEIIFLALEDFKRETLLADNSSFVSPFSGMSRREVIKKVGLASLIALPIISSIIAPTSAMAASGGPCVAPGVAVTGLTFPLPGPSPGNPGPPTCESILPTPNVACCSGIQIVVTVAGGLCQNICANIVL